MKQLLVVRQRASVYVYYMRCALECVVSIEFLVVAIKAVDTKQNT